MEKLRTLDLFSGIGGFSLGLDSTGYFETVAFCEIEEFPCKVLNKHWPNVPIYNDVRELSYEKLQADGLISRRRGIDVICGGYPCQPFSVAGRQKGEEDPRHLWPEYFRLIRELRPSYVIGENVGGHIRLGLDSVLEDLDSENYTVRCFSVEAASLGAPHRRERIFWIANNMANTDGSGRNAQPLSSAVCLGRENNSNAFKSGKTMGDTDNGHVSDAQFKGLEGRSRDNRGGGREVLSGIEDDGHSVRRQVRRTGGEDGGTTNDVSDTQSERRGGRNRGGRGAEQRELLMTKQEGRTLGREAERCSELPGQEGEGATTDVADAQSQLGERSESEGNQRGQSETAPGDRSGDTRNDADTHVEGLEVRGGERKDASTELQTSEREGDSRSQDRAEEERGETAFESYLGGGNDGISAWLDGSWERGIPRVAPTNKLRVPRLKALGNAVLPQLVYMVGMTIVLSTKRSENEEE